MIEMSAEDAYRKMTAFVGDKGLKYADWYCGITHSPEERLHGDHGVTKTHRWWMSLECATARDARQVEQWLLKSGCYGGTGGGDANSVYVYAYIMTDATNP